MFNRRIEKANLEDVKGIYSLIKKYSKKKLMLFRHSDEIERNIRDYLVYRENGKVYGCVGLRTWDRKSAEIYGLAVDDSKVGNGIGTKLIKNCIAEARKLKVPFVFTLTFRINLFQRFGFEKIKMSSLPRVIFTEKTVDIDKAYGMKL